MSGAISDRCTCRGGMWKRPDNTWSCHACAKIETEEEHAKSRNVLKTARVAHVRMAATEALRYAPKGEPGSVMLWASDVLEVFDLLDAANYRAELAEAEKALAEAQREVAWMEYHQKLPRLGNHRSTAENEQFQRNTLVKRLDEAHAALTVIKAKGQP